MKIVRFYSIDIPYSGQPKETSEEYMIIAQNKRGKACINDSVFTTIDIVRSKYSSHNTLNIVKAYKSKWGLSSDGWHAYVYYQCTEKVMKRKVLTTLKKEIQKECFLDSEALSKLNSILNSKK